MLEESRTFMGDERQVLEKGLLVLEVEARLCSWYRGLGGIWGDFGVELRTCGKYSSICRCKGRKKGSLSGIRQILEENKELWEVVRGFRRSIGIFISSTRFGEG